MGRPVPTVRALWVAAVSLVPAVVAVLSPAIAPGLLAFDLALLVLVVVDFFLAPRAAALVVRRTLEPVLSAGRSNPVHLELSRPLPRHGEVWVSGPPAACTGVSAGLVSSRHPSVLAGFPWVKESLAALGVPTAGEAGLMRHAAAFFQGNRTSKLALRL